MKDITRVNVHKFLEEKDQVEMIGTRSREIYQQKLIKGLEKDQYMKGVYTWVLALLVRIKYLLDRAGAKGYQFGKKITNNSSFHYFNNDTATLDKIFKWIISLNAKK